MNPPPGIDPPQSAHDPPTGRVPRQQSIPSDSQLPSPPSKRPMSSQIASPRFVKQFHTLIERQREVHGEERALWHTERAELHEKIAGLEAALRQYQSIPSSNPLSPTEKGATSRSSSFWNPSSASQSRQLSRSGSATGDEVWRPKSDREPTRTFSDSPNQATKLENRLPSIAEDIPTRSLRQSNGNGVKTQGAALKSSTNELQSDKNLDGINFKSNNFTPTNGKNIMTPQSPSPLSPSPSVASPSTIQLPPSILKAPPDLYTKDAGHTPLARRANPDDDDIASNPSSSAATPTQPETERPPLEPHVTKVRPPNERLDSYFPVIESNPNDADPELKGPLGLTNNRGNDENFLNQLDSKLQRAARSDAAEASAVAGASDSNKPAAAAEENFEQPEQEPRLRIKRSMNFGTAFGAKGIGKGL